MERRDALKALVVGAVAGTACITFPSKAAEMDAPKPYWEEEDFEFMRMPGTRYLWPNDREIVFMYKPNDPRPMQRVYVPTFNWRRGSVEGHLASAVRASESEPDAGHLSLVFVRGYPDEIAIFINKQKCQPLTGDLYAEAAKRHLRDNRPPVLSVPILGRSAAANYDSFSRHGVFNAI